jgi:hypothetical protein
VNRLLALKDAPAYKNLFEEIFFVRDAFAHSFINIEQIKYKGLLLDRCFGYTYTGMALDIEEINFSFVEDLNELFKPMMEVFRGLQYQQIDREKFYKLCDRIVDQRSLAPGR